MNNEKRKFQVNVWVRGKSDKEKGQYLSKKVDLEINWLGDGEGQIKEEVVFEKDNKEYKGLIKVNKIKRGWFKDEVKDFKVESLSEEYYFPDKPEAYSISWFGGQKKRI